MVKEAVAGNTLWQHAIQKEMENVKITCRPILKDEKSPNGYEYVNRHMLFSVKVEDFYRIVCIVVKGHMANHHILLHISVWSPERWYALP